MNQIRLDISCAARQVLAAAAAMLFVVLTTASTQAAELPDSVVAIRVKGNETIAASHILQKISTQPNRPLTERMIREDIRVLRSTRLFSGVQTRFEESERGTVLVFHVKERPIVRRVIYRGNKKVKDKQLRSWTGLEAGSPFDHLANKEAEARILREYKEKGHYYARVKLVQGGKPGDRDVVFEIKEGPVVRVTRRDFKGLRELSAGRLKTKLATKQAWFGLFSGIYRPETLEQDKLAIIQYCRSLGYFDATVEAEPQFSPSGGVRIVYSVEEGQRFRVGDIRFEGNDLLSENQLRPDPELLEGEYYSERDLGKDVAAMYEPYWDRGHSEARIVPVPHFSEQEGIVDLIFRVDEDRPRYIRSITAEFTGDHPYTKDTVILDRFGMRPGDLADPRKIRRSRSRIRGGGLFSDVNVVSTPIDPETNVYSAGLQSQEDRVYRGQQPAGPPSSLTPMTGPKQSSLGGHSGISQRKAARADRQRSTTGYSSEPSRRLPARQSPSPTTATPPVTVSSLGFLSEAWGRPLTSSVVLPDTDTVIRAQSVDGPPSQSRNNPILEGGPYLNQFQTQPPGWVDLTATATEGRTGRIMFGAGVNSDNGVVGSAVWEENNFNWQRPPRTIGDILNGQAFRGGGQRFRVEAAPGDVVSRYAVNWVDQYFMNTDNSLSLSGFYFNRFFEDWDEERLGGRIGVGRQLSPNDSVNVSFRLEEVTIDNPRTPTPAQLAEVVGSNFLSTVRITGTNDTRDTAIFPGEGHFLELGFEQAFGEFTYSRWDGEGRQYFTLHQRPDGSGRQVLSFGTNIGFSTSDTPVFERYYAGGFQSFRGFAYRGVTPRVGSVSIGGTFQALATVEYRVPVTADDMIHVVTFADVGTVDNRVSFRDLRATVGVGLRVMIPALGQAPLAFDFGFPVASEAFDDERVFSFYVGLLR